MTKITSYLLLGLLTTLALPAAVIDDFARNDPGLVTNATVSVSLVDGAEGGTTGRALAIGWPFPHRPWVECPYRQPRPIPGLESNGVIAIQFDAWIPAAPSVIQIGLHLRDAGDETYLWSTKVAPATTAGWQQVVIPIDLENPAGHWGGNNNGVLDFPLRLGGYAAVFANDKVPAGRVLIRSVQSVPLAKITLETDRFPSLVNVSGTATCNLVLSNPADHPVDVTMQGVLRDFDGQTNPVAGAATIPVNGQGRLRIALPDRRPGIRWLDCNLSFGGKSIGYKTTFVIADPVARSGKPTDFMFGIVTHSEKSPAAVAEQEAQASAAAGATVMRVADAWVKIEPKPGEWHWETQDRLVALNAQYGLELDCLLGFNPTHAVAPELRAAQAEAYKQHDPNAWKIALFGPPEEATWRRYVAEMARRYQGKIRLYEVGNEPDLGFWRGTTDEYEKTLRAAFEEVHRADPKAQLLTGGFATVLEHQGRKQNHDLQERVLAEASDAFDIHAFHQHGLFKEFKTAVDGELARMRARMPHPRPLYFNETAVSSAFIGEHEQAVTLAKKLSFAMARDAIGYNWYELRNDTPNPSPTDMEENYGLLSCNFRPKAAFAAYSEIARQLHGKRHLGDLDLGPAREAYVFGGTSGRTLVWWNEKPDTAAPPVLLRCGPGPVQVVSIMGVAQDVPRVEDVVMVQPGSEPQYLNMPSGPGIPAVAGILVNLTLPAAAAVGQPVSATAELANPLGRALVIALSWSDASGAKTNASVSVSAHATARIPLAFPAPAARRVLHPVRLDFAAADTPWAGSLRETLPVVRVVGETSPDGRAADWVIEKPADLVDLCQADPALAALTWKGPDDLSARIWVWQQGQALHVRTDVRDNLHVQNEKPDTMWRGDSVQLALTTAGTKELWVIGAAMKADGQVMRAAWFTPPGVTNAETFFDAACQTIPGGLRYELTLPFDRFRLTGQVQQQGFRLNLLVNDNDGNARKCYMRIAPGLGEMPNPDLFPLLRFAGAASQGNPAKR